MIGRSRSPATPHRVCRPRLPCRPSRPSHFFAVLLAGCALLAACHASTFTLRRVAVDRAGYGDAALSPDGNHLVASSRRGGHWDLWLYDMVADQWTQLTDDPAEDSEAQWSPDGKQLVFTSDRAGNSKDIWRMRLDDVAHPVRLTVSEHDDDYPNWSPDGRRIVFTSGAWGQQDFYVVSAEGGIPERISRISGTGGACAFEPGGRELTCHRYDTGSGDLSTIALGDGTLKRLTTGRAWDYKPNPSPDGAWIAFSRAVDGPSTIQLMASTGGPPVALTAGPFDDRWPSWSADGQRVLFQRHVEEGVAVGLFERRRGSVRWLVGEADHPLMASLHPGGAELAYCAIEGTRRVVRIRDLVRGTVLRLPGDDEACYPRWSPDGSTLALTLKRHDRWEVATWRRGDALPPRPWTERFGHLRGMDGLLAWAPGGTEIVFQADTQPFEANLFVVQLTTGDVRPLTTGGYFDEAPSWSPAGDAVFFMSTRGGEWTWGLFRMDVVSGRTEPIVGPDYRQKNFVSQGGSGSLLWSEYDARNVEWVVEKRAYAEPQVMKLLGPGARWPSYTGDDESILFTAVRDRSEYWLVSNPLGPGSPVRAGSLGSGRVGAAP